MRVADHGRVIVHGGDELRCIDCGCTWSRDEDAPPCTAENKKPAPSKRKRKTPYYYRAGDKWYG